MRRGVVSVVALVLGLVVGAGALLAWRGRCKGQAVPTWTPTTTATATTAVPLVPVAEQAGGDVAPFPEKVPVVPGGSLVLAWGREPLPAGTADRIAALGVGPATEVRRDT